MFSRYYRFTKTFLSADIPLYKLENKKLNELFNYVQVPLHPVRTTRRYVESISSRVQLEILEKLNNKNTEKSFN